jgi:hypothetical protein
VPEKVKFEKPPTELVARFESVLARVATPETTRRQMFGHPCAWIGGNMATGLFASSWWVRLPPDEQERLLAAGEATTFSVMPGRPMKGYVVMPDAVVEDDTAVDDWVRRALDYTATLPPKQK